MKYLSGGVSMLWLLGLLLLQFGFAGPVENPVFQPNTVFENQDDLIFSTSLRTPFLYEKAKYQDLIHISNKTDEPRKKILINLYKTESDPMPSEHFENGKSVLIKKGTQWLTNYATPGTVTLETVRQSPKHTLMCRVQILRRGLFSPLEVGDMKECMNALKLKLRKSEPDQKTYIIE